MSSNKPHLILPPPKPSPQSYWPLPTISTHQGDTKTIAQTKKAIELLDADSYWIWGFGSLIWRPGFTFIERRLAYLPNYHRRVFQGSDDHRGQAEHHGLVVTVLEKDHPDLYQPTIIPPHNNSTISDEQLKALAQQQYYVPDLSPPNCPVPVCGEAVEVVDPEGGRDSASKASNSSQPQTTPKPAQVDPQQLFHPYMNLASTYQTGQTFLNPGGAHSGVPTTFTPPVQNPLHHYPHAQFPEREKGEDGGQGLGEMVTINVPRGGQLGQNNDQSQQNDQDQSNDPTENDQNGHNTGHVTNSQVHQSPVGTSHILKIPVKSPTDLSSTPFGRIPAFPMHLINRDGFSAPNSPEQIGEDSRNLGNGKNSENFKKGQNSDDFQNSEQIPNSQENQNSQKNQKSNDSTRQSRRSRSRSRSPSPPPPPTSSPYHSTFAPMQPDYIPYSHIDPETRETTIRYIKNAPENSEIISKTKHFQHHDRTWGVAYRINPEEVVDIVSYLTWREQAGYDCVVNDMWSLKLDSDFLQKYPPLPSPYADDDCDQVVGTTDHHLTSIEIEQDQCPIHISNPGTFTPVRCVMWLAAPDNPYYRRCLHDEFIAYTVARARGESGPNMEYLLKLYDFAKSSGTYDEHLTRVVALIRAEFSKPNFRPFPFNRAAVSKHANFSSARSSTSRGTSPASSQKTSASRSSEKGQKYKELHDLYTATNLKNNVVTVTPLSSSFQPNTNTYLNSNQVAAMGAMGAVSPNSGNLIMNKLAQSSSHYQNSQNSQNSQNLTQNLQNSPNSPNSPVLHHSNSAVSPSGQNSISHALSPYSTQSQPIQYGSGSGAQNQQNQHNFQQNQQNQQNLQNFPQNQQNQRNSMRSRNSSQNLSARLDSPDSVRTYNSTELHNGQDSPLSRGRGGPRDGRNGPSGPNYAQNSQNYAQNAQNNVKNSVRVPYQQSLLATPCQDSSRRHCQEYTSDLDGAQVNVGGRGLRGSAQKNLSGFALNEFAENQTHLQQHSRNSQNLHNSKNSQNQQNSRINDIDDSGSELGYSDVSASESDLSDSEGGGRLERSPGFNKSGLKSLNYVQGPKHAQNSKNTQNSKNSQQNPQTGPPSITDHIVTDFYSTPSGNNTNNNNNNNNNNNPLSQSQSQPQRVARRTSFSAATSVKTSGSGSANGNGNGIGIGNGRNQGIGSGSGKLGPMSSHQHNNNTNNHNTYLSSTSSIPSPMNHSHSHSQAHAQTYSHNQTQSQSQSQSHNPTSPGSPSPLQRQSVSSNQLSQLPHNTEIQQHLSSPSHLSPGHHGSQGLQSPGLQALQGFQGQQQQPHSPSVDGSQQHHQQQQQQQQQHHQQPQQQQLPLARASTSSFSLSSHTPQNTHIPHAHAHAHAHTNVPSHAQMAQYGVKSSSPHFNNMQAQAGVNVSSFSLSQHHPQVQKPKQQQQQQQQYQQQQQGQ